MKPLRLILLLTALLAAPLAAQQGPVPQASPAPAEEGGLTGEVSDESEWQDLGIAIPAFATNADVPTPASAGSTGALGTALAEVISGNLRNNGLFKPTGPSSLPTPSMAEVTTPAFATWS